MHVIKAAHYGEVVTKLMADPIIIDMAGGLKGVPMDKLAHDDGGPRFEFMQGANREFDKRGGGKDLPLHIGAVAEALLELLKKLEEEEE